MLLKAKISRAGVGGVALLCLALCLGKETRAEDDVFNEEMRKPAARAKFVPLEDANADLAPGQNEAPVALPAPIDLIAEEAPEPDRHPAEEDEREDGRHPDEDAVAKREVENGVERITLKNGDVILNVKQGADFEKTMQKELGGEFGEAEAPIRPPEDWAVFPAANR